MMDKSRWLEHMITDLKSARAIIDLMKAENPDLTEVIVPRQVKQKIITELNSPTWQITVRGVWVLGMG